MPTKKSAKKKAAAKKTSAKKKPAKRKAVKKTAKRKAVKKTARKKVKKAAASKETMANKVGTRITPKAAGKAKKTVTKKASDYIKKPPQTPAIFKTPSKRPIHILFTLEDVREVLKKRAAEEKAEKAKSASPSNQTMKTVPDPKVLEEAKPQNSKHVAASLDDILGTGGSLGGSRPGESHVPRKFQKYYRLLIELRDEVRAELNLHSSDTLKRSQKEDAGDIAISVDAGTDNFDRDFALSLLSSEQEALNEIEAAIKRIQNGTYGVCEVTGEPIKAERLEAVPFTRFSLEGQRQYESNSFKRISRAGAFLNEASGEAITFGDDDAES